MERVMAFLGQTVIVGALAWISAKLGIMLPVLAILIALMVVDYITGFIASKVEAIDHPDDKNYGWSSKKGAKGIAKKVAYMCVVVVAMLVDYIIVIISAQLGWVAPISGVFGFLVAIWYILNECLSIVENAGRMGADVPVWLAKYIAVLKNKVDNTADGGSGKE